jgi:hypothetical protein
MTASEIVDKLYPYTKEEMRCGFQKAKKCRLRCDMITKINEYRDGNSFVVLPIEVLSLLQHESL